MFSLSILLCGIKKTHSGKKKSLAKKFPKHRYGPPSLNISKHMFSLSKWKITLEWWLQQIPFKQYPGKFFCQIFKLSGNSSAVHPKHPALYSAFGGLHNISWMTNLFSNFQQQSPSHNPYSETWIQKHNYNSTEQEPSSVPERVWFAESKYVSSVILFAQSDKWPLNFKILFRSVYVCFWHTENPLRSFKNWMHFSMSAFIVLTVSNQIVVFMLFPILIISVIQLFWSESPFTWFSEHIAQIRNAPNLNIFIFLWANLVKMMSLLNCYLNLKKNFLEILNNGYNFQYFEDIVIQD